MTRDEFDELLSMTFSSLAALSDTKGTEYAHDADQLANFKRLGERLGMAPEAVLMVYLTKHLDSIESYIRRPSMDLSEPIDGRIDDAILYLCLLKALIHDSDRPANHAALPTGYGCTLRPVPDQSREPRCQIGSHPAN